MLSAKSTLSSSRKTAQLIRKTILTPTVGRFTFSVPEGVKYSPGQWAAFDFSEHLDLGYSHMRNDDPRSLNDDFVRTFTISSTPNAKNESEKEFDITIRNVGVVTNFLFRQNDRAGFEVPLVGVGGEFGGVRRASFSRGDSQERAVWCSYVLCCVVKSLGNVQVAD